MIEDGHEVASHGWRWIDYHGVDEADRARAHPRSPSRRSRGLTGSAPLGWYTGRTSENTRRLVVEHGGFLYDADSYADDLPYWETVGGKPQLIVPYTLDTNDMRFATPQGFNSGAQFFDYLKDAFDTLYAEGETRAEDALGRAALPPRGPPGAHRVARALPRLRAAPRARVDLPPRGHRAALDRAPSVPGAGLMPYPGVAVARRSLEQLNALDCEAFVARLGAIYEHSPWVAQGAWAARPFAALDALLRGHAGCRPAGRRGSGSSP